MRVSVTIAARTHKFIVCIWWEPRELPSADPIWRGYIQSVATEQRTYFGDLASLTRILERSLGIAPPRHPTWWQRLINHLKR
jgi:hypothetical protein